jgi:hypothetical protein
MFDYLRCMQSWAEIDVAVAEAAVDFDPSLLSVADAVALLPRLTRAKNTLAAVESMVAGRIAESDRWQASGARSPAEDYAKRTGTPIGQARDALAAAKAMAESQRLRAAAMAGKVSPTQAGVIGDAAEDAPDAVDDLLDLVEQAAANGGGGAGSLQDLKSAADTARANADPDPEATNRRIHAERELRMWVRAQRGHTHATGTASDNAWLAAQLEPIIDELRLAARLRGEVPSAAALRYDALFELIARGAGIEAPRHEPHGRTDGIDDDSGAARNGGTRPPRAPRGGPAGGGSTPPTTRPGNAPGVPRMPVPREPLETPRAGAPYGDVSLRAPFGTTATSAEAAPGAPARVATGRFAGGVLLDPAPAADEDAAPESAERADSLSPDGSPRTRPGGPAPPRGPSTRSSPRAAGRAWSRAMTIIRVDASAAQRGRAVAGERCEIAGAGPVPVSDVENALAEGSRLAIVSTAEDGSVLRVAHVRGDRARRIDIRDPEALAAELARIGRNVAGVVLQGRRANAYQVTALKWISPLCTVEGCNNPNCEIDHKTGYAVTRDTKLGDLDPLCRYHHRLKTLNGWALVAGHGKRAFVPPDDPRHPGKA